MERRPKRSAKETIFLEHVWNNVCMYMSVESRIMTENKESAKSAQSQNPEQVYHALGYVIFVL